MIYKKNIFSSLIFLMAIVISFINFAKISYADKDKKPTKDSLLDGLRQISAETYNLKDMRDIRFNKLKKDLEEFKDKGSAKISEKNYFYLLNPTNFTAEELEWGLAGTNLNSLGKDFKEVSEDVEINPILLMAMAKHETGNGTSDLYKHKKNLFGFNAYDYDPYNQATDFENERSSIDTVAKHLKNEYLNKEGKFYNGISTAGIGKLYATDKDWSKKVDWMMIEVAQAMIKAYEVYDWLLRKE